MNHRSVPSLSSSIASNDTSANNSPRTSTSNNSSYNCSFLDLTSKKRHSEPAQPAKRWDDSQLEMELAEDDLIPTKVRRSSSLRFRQTIHESLKEKFRHRQQQQQQQQQTPLPSIRLSKPFKKIRNWLF
ncbi:hypothetical protein [Parasitella parasitica]|uniref:Uncharacterized protein n=1 Tax=Parasitella parasitica TaxID=35722 RepID=A0A0B7NGG1_9FUNG|nr:hypothetical protein [Parasitella parasitica]